MPRPVSLKEVADAAGVAKSTASYALKDSPLIKESTRAKVRAVAEKLGYHIDPTLSRALAKSRSGKRSNPGSTVVAYLTNCPSTFNEELFAAVQERATEVGLKAEQHFFDCKDTLSAKRTFQILAAKGIRAIVIGPLETPVDTLPVEWDRFACVVIGASLRNPHLHSVQKDLILETRESIGYLQAQGCKRIGFLIHAEFDSRKGNPVLSEVLRYRFQLLEDNNAQADKVRDAVFWYHGSNVADYAEWHKRFKPDSLVIDNPIDWLKGQHKGFDRLPKVFLYKHPKATDITGFTPEFTLLGRTAVDIVSNELAKRAYGIPKVPQRSLFTTEISVATEVGAPR
ncbi:LacI family DNA-binding transcriptional regulator [Coraliomargarita parva]|uniref:LacI family DNA-binding transcriptional regulator n=1 Tax=Coraliomargarita parva TaxID=3014050 RepID=UPI0022B4FB9B|nr:LacI family DNA-binding transcriptional regulator [Coraliomargarita parva]